MGTPNELELGESSIQPGMLTFQLIMKSINIVIVTALAIVINLKVSQPSAAKENKPNGCFCVGLNIGFSYREPFLMPSI